jgi:putative transcriptional regulator
MRAAVHHPPDETLAVFAAGTLSEGETLVVATHVETCATCQAWVRTLEDIGGILLEDYPPLALAPDALRETVAQLPDAPADPGTISASPVAVSDMVDLSADLSADLPAVLLRYQLGPWEVMGPGMEYRRIMTSDDGKGPVILARLSPGAALEPHGHEDKEWICILAGAFQDEHGHYGVGDFVAADQDTIHTPIADQQAGCLCVVTGH